MEKKRAPKRDIPDKKPQLFLMDLESWVRPIDGEGVYPIKFDLYDDWFGLKGLTSYDSNEVDVKSTKELKFLLYEKKKIFDHAIISNRNWKSYPGKYKQAIRPYEKKAYTDLERRNDITDPRFELRFIAVVGMWLAYAMVTTDFGETSYIPDVVKECLNKLGISTDWTEKFKYEKENEESIANIFLLTLAAALRVLFEAQREENMQAPTSKNNEDILWFLEMFGITANDITTVGHRKVCLHEDFQIVEEKIIRYIWESRQDIFDHHRALQNQRDDVILSDYYIAPKLTCVNDASAKFFLHKKGNEPIRCSLTAASGYGKSSLFQATMMCATLDKAKQYGLVTSAEEKGYRKLQKELIGSEEPFPQFLPIIIPGGEFGEADSFVKMFAEKVFPTDEHTPEDELTEKNRLKKALETMVVQRASDVMFFCDAFDEVPSGSRSRYVEQFREIVNHECGFNVILSYRPFCDGGRFSKLAGWRGHQRWTIEPLRTWGIDEDTQKHKLWLLIRKATDCIVFSGVESDNISDRIYERLRSNTLLESFTESPYLTRTFVDLCFAKIGGVVQYTELPVYDLIELTVNRLFARFNPDYSEKYDTQLLGPHFREICRCIAFNLIQDRGMIVASQLSEIFLNAAKEKVNDDRTDDRGQKFPNYEQWFDNQIKCESVNSESGVLILNSKETGYIFQANATTLPFLASIELYLKIYEIEGKDDADEELKREIRNCIGNLNEDYYDSFVPLLLAVIHKAYAGKKIAKLRKPAICNMIIETAAKTGLPDFSTVLNDKSFIDI